MKNIVCMWGLSVQLKVCNIAAAGKVKECLSVVLLVDVLQVDKADLCKLCVHRLPGAHSSKSSSSSSSDAIAASVKASLAAACKQAGAGSEAAAVEAAAVEQLGSSGKQQLFLVFKHAGEANEVFAALPGERMC